MSWQGNWSGSSGQYMPLGFATAGNDGTVHRPNEPGYPLVDNYNHTYDPAFARSPPYYSDAPRRSDPTRTSPASTLLGGDYFQSPPQQFPHAGGFPRKPVGYANGFDYNQTSPLTDHKHREHRPEEHKPLKQFFHLLGTGLARFLVTAFLVIGLWQIIWTYNKFEILNTAQKRFFNFLVTAFSLALGLNLASSLKSVAVKARWWIISWGKRPLDEAETILRCSALTEVFKLGCRSTFKKPSLAFGCAVWLLINLATQVFVACLGLNWSLNSAVNSSSAVPGLVLYPNLTQFYFGPGGNTAAANQRTAHMYGDLALNYNFNKSSDIPGRLPIIAPLALYSANNFTDFWDFDTYSQHVFMDYPANHDTSIGRFYSNRSITTEASCKSTRYIAALQRNGTVTMAGYNSLQPNSTIYWIIQNRATCGPRCARVFALENRGTQGALFDCSVTVGNVMNASPFRPAQALSDDLALMAAQSIAISGYGGSKASTTDQGSTYFDGDFWGFYLDANHTTMEWVLRVHAIGSLVGANWYNDDVADPIPALVPDEGVTLNLDHPGFIELILGGIGAFHFIFFIIAAWLSNKVVVVHDSYLAIALLMRPVVDQLDHGSLMNDEDICRALKHPQVMFGTVDRHTVRGRIKHLEISEMSGKPRGGWKGWYD